MATGGEQGPGKTGARAKRAPTIELKATEVKTEAAEKSAKASEPEKKQASKDTGSAGKQAGGKPGAEKKPLPKGSKKPGSKASSSGVLGSLSSKDISCALLAGLAGGLVVLLGGWLLGLWGGKGAEDLAARKSATAALAQTDTMKSEIAGLKNEIAGLAKPPAKVDLSPVLKRIETVEARTDAFGKALPADALKDSLAGLSAEMGTQKQALAGLDTRLGEMSGRLEAAVKATASGEPGAAKLAVVAEQMTALEKRLDAGLKAGDATVKSQGAKLSSRLGALETSAGQIETARKETKDLQGRLAALRADVVRGLEAVKSAIPAPSPLDKEGLNALTARFEAIEKRLGEPGNARQAALALAVTNLGRAVDGGGSYASELSAVAALAPKGTDLSALKTHAGGVATRRALIARFPAALRSILDAANAPQDDSIVNKLLSNAKSIVRVRRTGHVQGAGTQAVVARMEEKVKAGDLAGALEESSGLSGKPAGAAAPWVTALKARLDAENAVAALSARILSDLGAKGQ